MWVIVFCICDIFLKNRQLWEVAIWTGNAEGGLFWGSKRTLPLPVIFPKKSQWPLMTECSITDLNINWPARKNTLKSKEEHSRPTQPCLPKLSTKGCGEGRTDRMISLSSSMGSGCWTIFTHRQKSRGWSQKIQMEDKTLQGKKTSPQTMVGRKWVYWPITYR